MIYTISIPSRLRTVSEEGNKGVYEVDALHPGYGHTIGNSLRRVLLSSLPGAAITKVRIQGAAHEFSTIPDVKEDVISILLNLKQVRILMHSDEPQTLRLSFQGIKKIKAGDFEVPSQVEIVNSDAPVATLTSKDAKLELEATVEKGLGYVPREVLQRDEVGVGILTLDAIFTPIRKVNYEVENMRVGERTDYSRLRISIETDGSISPRAALEKSVSLLVEQLEALVRVEEAETTLTLEREEVASPEPRPSEEEVSGMEGEEQLKIRIEDLGLTSRTQNALGMAGIRTVGGLVKKSKQDLLALSGIGEKAVLEIERSLAGLGLALEE